MEGQVCLFNCNRQWEHSNQLPVSPGHVRPETSRTWRTCWNSQNQYYSRNVGRWLFTQCSGVRHGSVCLHALVLINSHSGWITPSIDTRRSPEVIKQAPLPQILPLAPCFFFYFYLPFSLSRVSLQPKLNSAKSFHKDKSIKSAASPSICSTMPRYISLFSLFHLLYSHQSNWNLFLAWNCGKWKHLHLSCRRPFLGSCSSIYLKFR